MSEFHINHAKSNQLEDEVIKAHANAVSEYRDKIREVVEQGNYNQPESALSLPDDTDLHEQVSAAVQSLTSNGQLEVVVVIGMGGSSRGTKAVYELLERQTESCICFVDSVSESIITDTVSKIQTQADSLSDVGLCVVSKSGTTAETISNFTVLVDALADIYTRDDIYKRSVAITDPGSPLETRAKEVEMTTVHIPNQVGGRFSVLSAVGLVPLSLAGLNTEQLLAGAASMRQSCLSGRVLADPAAVIASVLYEHSQNARRILNHFFFTQKAETLGKWSAQLFAESLGKRKNRQGEPVYTGLYPTTTIGPDDLHSLFQLQLGGPKNFVSILVRETDTNRSDLARQINSDKLLADKLEHILGRSLGNIQEAFGKAVRTAFREDERPFVEITVPELNAYHTGQFLLLEELVVMYLGDLFNVNAFNQPEVENYKSTARKLLEEMNQ